MPLLFFETQQISLECDGWRTEFHTYVIYAKYENGRMYVRNSMDIFRTAIIRIHKGVEINTPIKVFYQNIHLVTSALS
jgi:hypothetical protein